MTVQLLFASYLSFSKLYGFMMVALQVQHSNANDNQYH
uniref:Uncharacterized protein n=1 Tax=Serratia marcescens TaxID=615 RepID=A0A345IPE4_SERMA|nr:hypothetical protein [Serratia marcescens]DAC77309.1 TPA_exp: hypothetical protein [Serratia marcescens]